MVIEHTLPDQSKVCTIYGHVNIGINENAIVTKGTALGTVGDFSCPEGWVDHVHFGVYNGAFGSPVGTYPSWLHGYLPPSTFPGSYLKPDDFVLSHQTSYSCQWISQNPSEPTWGKPGDVRTYWVKYKNTGTATWVNTGGVTEPDYVELRSCDIGGNLVNSWFDPVGWINRQRVTSCEAVTVAPNEVAQFTFDAEIPNVPSGQNIDVHFRPWHGGETMNDWGGLSYRINVDADPPQNPPSLTVNPSDCATSNAFFFDWGSSADPGGSGLKQYRWKINSGSETTTTATSVQVNNSSAVHPDWNTFYVRAEDNVGNVSDYSTVQLCLLGDNNLSFEIDGNGDQIPDGWTVSIHGGCTYTYMTNSGPDGQRYVRFVNADDNDWVHLIHDINGLIQPNHTYRLSFWYKTNCTGSFGWRLFSSDHVSYSSLLNCIVDAPQADSQWHRFWGAPFSLTSSQLADYPCFGARITTGKIGTFNFDGVVIEEVEPCE